MTNAIAKQIHFTEQSKKLGVAYALCWFLGMIGAHNFYLNRDACGGGQLALFGGGLVLIPFGGIGIALIAASFIWAIADLFIIPAEIKKYNLQLMQKLGMD